MNNLTRILYQHPVLANLLFVLVLSLGALSYLQLPREQDPNINFNWINVSTILPGASAEDVEKLVTDPLEEAVNKLADIRFVSSNSREGLSNILIRFNDLDTDTFDKRLSDLRREVQAKEDDLPEEANTPKIIEITSANAFPTAILVVVGQANDERLRLQAKAIKEDIERINGVDRVESFGLQAPELQVMFEPEALVKHHLNAIDLATTIKAHFRDVSAGTLQVGSQEWLVRWVGRNEAPEELGRVPILTAGKELNISDVAKVQRGREKASRLVNYQGKHAILLTVMKKGNSNTLTLVGRVREYIAQRNLKSAVTGMEVVLLDDQTEVTRNALSIMQTNAVFGLALVLLTTWAFLGFKIASLVSIGIPFTLCGTFMVLNYLGQTLNVSVLLAVVISLGMLVDDSVVVVEAIHCRLVAGRQVIDAIIGAMREVFAPVTTSVLTTAAAFTPLMLLPGILGKFMMVIPLVVTLALLLSLIEAFWMLPAHVAASNVKINHAHGMAQKRQQLTRWLHNRYMRLLIKLFRHPWLSLGLLIGLIGLALAIVGLGLIHYDFFANDPKRIFYVNVEMAPGTSLAETLRQTRKVEQKVRRLLPQDAIRSTSAYAGLMFRETEPYYGDKYGQIVVSLLPENQLQNPKHVDEILAEIRDQVLNTPGPLTISFLRLQGGPPTSKPINIKVRGNDYQQIRAAVTNLKQALNSIEHVFDVSDDDSLGRVEMVLTPNLDAIYRARLEPSMVARLIRMLADGEVLTDFQSQGEKVEVRLRAQPKVYSGISDVLHQTFVIGNRDVRLSELVQVKTQPSLSNIRHYNFRRAITITGDIDKAKLDTVTVNNQVKALWQQQYLTQYPDIDLNFSGALDDIEESLSAMPKLFLFGVGLIYLILGTQFGSYFQPFMILITIPLAFSGVVFGLFVTQNPLSLYTLYGIVALSGITVNASIVLISAANQRLANGMSLTYAILYAARRRLIPILITSLTTIAGLFSLATGLGGKSLLWGPVATSIVWGLLFSTSLTLLFIPLVYVLTMRRAARPGHKSLS